MLGLFYLGEPLHSESILFSPTFFNMLAEGRRFERSVATSAGVGAAVQHPHEGEALSRREALSRGPVLFVREG